MSFTLVSGFRKGLHRYNLGAGVGPGVSRRRGNVPSQDPKPRQVTPAILNLAKLYSWLARGRHRPSQQTPPRPPNLPLFA